MKLTLGNANTFLAVNRMSIINLIDKLTTIEVFHLHCRRTQTVWFGTDILVPSKGTWGFGDQVAHPNQKTFSGS